MHRFYLPPAHCQGSTLTIEDREAHHGLHVLRLRRGERVVVLDGAGHELLCETRGTDRNAIQLDVVQRNFIAPLPYQVTLLQAIPKGKVFETIIQKATELGVHRIVPLLSERIVSHLDDESAEAKAAKWRIVAIEASKQCGSAWLPQIDLPVSPKAFLSRGEKFELPLIASLQPDNRHPRELFKTFFAERQRLPQTVCIWIGPEGDFTKNEIELALQNNFIPVSLGETRLRSETAGVVAATILKFSS